MWPSSSLLRGRGPPLCRLSAPSLVHRRLCPPVTRFPLPRSTPVGSPPPNLLAQDQSRSVELLSSISVRQTIGSSPIRPQRPVCSSCPTCCAARPSLLARGGLVAGPGNLGPTPRRAACLCYCSGARRARALRPTLLHFAGQRCRSTPHLRRSSSVASDVQPPTPPHMIPGLQSGSTSHAVGSLVSRSPAYRGEVTRAMQG
ncbi:hypothetical protein NDU88_001959 [Pleurodeles waltl]|uniref:Uncharacterized protein n=1 Tax=Pleurodeles waltl TaxID=8319 RepID=A0AAV7VBM9_PLEWA|nr:hypothetical protein NDU88_001959 [Pleurodeles waltl]